MCSKENEQKPISVQIVGSHGLVWSIPDIMRLRQEYRIVGSMVGGITGFKTQVAVSGLPLKLSAEEVTLALQEGWIQLYETCFTVQTEQNTDPQQLQLQLQLQQQQQEELQQRIQLKKQRQQIPDDVILRDVEQYDEYYALYYGLPPPTPEQQHEQQLLQAKERQQQQQQEMEQQQQQAPVPPWQASVSAGNLYEIPLTVQQRLLQQHRERGQQQRKEQQQEQEGKATEEQQQQLEQQTSGLYNVSGSSSSYEAPAEAAPAAALRQLQQQWHYPKTHQQQLRMAVFRDLHERGYYLTNGAKFGGQFLAYPGDPSLYHAQFVVRVLPVHLNLNPVLLKGLARGVHSARKQLLLATVVEQQQQQQQQHMLLPKSGLQQQQQQQHNGDMPKQQQQPSGDAAGRVVEQPATVIQMYRDTSKVLYITVAKEDGFGSHK